MFEYPEAIKISTKFGMNCLQLALLLDREECLTMLFQSNLIDLKDFENDEKSDNSMVDLEFLNNSKNTLEAFIREVTLCDSIRNSSLASSIKQWNSQDVQEEDYLELHEILEDFRATENKPKPMKRPKHKYFKLNKPPPHSPENIPKELSEKYSSHQEGIKLIQKNVRGWLLRRQYLDIKYATRILQNCNFISFIKT